MFILKVVNAWRYLNIFNFRKLIWVVSVLCQDRWVDIVFVMRIPMQSCSCCHFSKGRSQFLKLHNLDFRFLRKDSKDVFMKMLNNGRNIDPCGTSFIRHSNICIRKRFLCLALDVLGNWPFLYLHQLEDREASNGNPLIGQLNPFVPNTPFL